MLCAKCEFQRAIAYQLQRSWPLNGWCLTVNVNTAF